MSITEDRLRAWCHWKRLEKDVDKDSLLMVEAIEATLDVVEAAKAVLEENYIESQHNTKELSDTLDKLEAIE